MSTQLFAAIIYLLRKKAKSLRVVPFFHCAELNARKVFTYVHSLSPLCHGIIPFMKVNNTEEGHYYPHPQSLRIQGNGLN